MSETRERDAPAMQAFITGLLAASMHAASGNVLTAPVTTIEVTPGLLRVRLASGLVATIRVDVDAEPRDGHA